MTVELSVLKLFVDNRETYLQYAPYLNNIQNFVREIKVLYGLVHEYYQKYDESS